MDRKHIKYQQTNIDDSIDDSNDDDSNDETNETTAMMSRDNEDVEELGFADEEDQQDTPPATPEHNPPPDVSIEDPPPMDEDADGDGNETVAEQPDEENHPEDLSNAAATSEQDGTAGVEQEDNDANEVVEARGEEEEEGVTSSGGVVLEEDAAVLMARVGSTDEEAGGIEMTETSMPVGSTDHPDETDSPPPYGEPPTYDEAMDLQIKARHGQGASMEDLEWDQDEHVTPTKVRARDGRDEEDGIRVFGGDTDDGIRVSGRDVDDGIRVHGIELEDVIVVPDSTGAAAMADTSFTTSITALPPPPIELSYPLPSEETSSSQNNKNTNAATPPPPPLDLPYPSPSEETSSSGWMPDVKFSEIPRRTWLVYGVSFLVAICALLMVILLPLSFSYIEYYQYGMRKGRISAVVEYAKEVYDMGRYAIGPGKTFKRYPAWAHYVDYERIGVFTTDKIILEAHISFQYFIKQDELGLIERKYDRTYEDTIKSVAEAALKNKGATYSTVEYYAQRGKVEQGLHDAVRLKLGGDCCPNRDECIRLSTCHLCNVNQTLCNKGFHVDVRFFQLKQLFVPQELTERQLNVQLILERNEEEVHRQAYQLIVKDTEKDTEKILNEADIIIQNGTSQARLITKRSNSTASAKRESAHNRGLTLLYNVLNIDSEEHKASLHWLRTLERHERIVRGMSFKEYIALMQGLHDDD